MQKKSYFFLIIRFVVHGIISGSIAIAIFIIGIWLLQSWASENPGGKFWELLNKILASGNWQNSDGTVKNAQKFNGKTAQDFVPASKSQSCGENQCIYGFNSDGTVMCR